MVDGVETGEWRGGLTIAIHRPRRVIQLGNHEPVTGCRARHMQSQKGLIVMS